MRIAFFVSRFPNPSETWILAQVEGLLAQGAHVDVVALAEGDRSVSAALAQRWGPRLVQYTIAVGKTLPARVLEAPGALARGPVAALDQSRFDDDARSLRLLIAAARWPSALKEERVWLAHYGRWGSFACNLRELGLIAGPIATMFHGRDMSVYLRRRPNAYARLFQRGQLFLPISDLWRAVLVSLGAPQTRTLTHRMGVDAKAFAYAPRLLGAGEKVRFVGVGRMVEKKGFDDAIDAFSALRNCAASLTLIGEGRLRAKLEARAEKAIGHNAHAEIRFTGALTHEQVGEELSRAHLFVLASKTARDGDMEGVPVAMMEAMAQGLPVLSTRHSAIPELVEDGSAGLLCAEGDVEGLGANMARLAQAPDLWAKMGASGAKRVSEEFDLERWNTILLERLRTMGRGS